MWNTGDAYFLSTPNSFPFVSVGGIWVGATKFRYQSFNNVYADSTSMLSINPTAWKVTGAGTIPSFTYTNNDSLPTYTGCVLLPDTIYRSQNLNLQINGVSGANLVEIILGDGTSVSAAHQITQFTSSVSTNNTISIIASSMSGFTPYSSSSSYGSLQINFQKYNDQPISGKTFRFISQSQINKNVYIK